MPLNLCPRDSGYPEIDYAVTGEAERALPDLLNALVKEKTFHWCAALRSNNTLALLSTSHCNAKSFRCHRDEAPLSRQLIDN